MLEKYYLNSNLLVVALQKKTCLIRLTKRPFPSRIKRHKTIPQIAYIPLLSMHTLHLIMSVMG